MVCRYQKIKKNIPLEIFLEDEICYNDYVAISSINRMTSGGIFMLWTRSELKVPVETELLVFCSCSIDLYVSFGKWIYAFL